ncbi:hypothetical protein C8R46DRAFT_1042399 [Mycena filopes]|nr:hypothetical protein C8R46DRAFT_1042399 [Mycena filopes]
MPFTFNLVSNRRYHSDTELPHILAWYQPGISLVPEYFSTVPTCTNLGNFRRQLGAGQSPPACHVSSSFPPRPRRSQRPPTHSRSLPRKATASPAPGDQFTHATRATVTIPPTHVHLFIPSSPSDNASFYAAGSSLQESCTWHTPAPSLRPMSPFLRRHRRPNSAGKVRFGSGSGYFFPNAERERRVRFRHLLNPEPEPAFTFGSASGRVRTSAEIGLLGDSNSGEKDTYSRRFRMLLSSAGLTLTQKAIESTSRLSNTVPGVTRAEVLRLGLKSRYQTRENSLKSTHYEGFRFEVRFKFGRAFQRANAEPERGVRFRQRPNVEPERGVQFGPVQVRTDIRTEPCQHYVQTQPETM